jgi:predicted SprT family Zn-dependent metalloprotease
MSITLPLWARNEPVMIHELCHLIVQHDYRCKGPKPAWHGWEFCQTYLKVVGNVMGPEARDALKASFKEEKVRFTPPRKKRELTEEQKQILRARMAVARAAKNRKNG